MPDSPERPLWQGRTLALLGILLVAANLRTAVAALSPIFAEIRVDFALSSIAVGVLGMLPPVCFAIFGIIAPAFTRRASLEAVMVFSLAAILLGDLGAGVLRIVRGAGSRLGDRVRRHGGRQRAAASAREAVLPGPHRAGHVALRDRDVDQHPSSAAHRGSGRRQRGLAHRRSGCGAR